MLLRVHGLFFRLPARLLYGGVPTSRPNPAGKPLLLLRTDKIGDFVLFTPALKYLRKIYAGRRITLVLDEQVCELAAACPYVDEVVGISVGRCRYDFLYWLRTVRKLRAKSFDSAIHCVYSRDPLADEILYCCGARERIGWEGDLNRQDRRLKRRTDSYYTAMLRPAADLTREIDKNRILVQQLGGEMPQREAFLPELWIGDRERQSARAILESEGLLVGNPLLVAMAPGASMPLKMWPAPRYAEVADRLVSEYGARVLLCGSRAEREVAHRIQQLVRQRLVILTGRTNLRETAALFELCDLFLGNDSGPLHLAVAMGTPTLGVRGGALSDRFYPYGPARRHRAVFKPMDCYQCNYRCIHETARCLQEIPTEQVWRELRLLIEEVVLPARNARASVRAGAWLCGRDPAKPLR